MKKNKVPKRIKNKMRRLARLHQQVGALENEVTNFFVELGYPEDFLRSGIGITLDELQDGVDITDKFCAWIESGRAMEELRDAAELLSDVTFRTEYGGGKDEFVQ